MFRNKSVEHSCGSENRVLVLTTAFPPDTGGRAVRLRTRIKYLIRNHDWQPVVVIGQESGTLKKEHITIEGEEIPVYREETDSGTSSLTADGYFSQIKSYIANQLIPDHYVVRLPSIIRAVGPIIEAENIDSIYTMCYPFTFHLVGHWVKREYGVGWLAEFRDPWVTNPNHFNGDAGVVNQYLERKVVESSDQVVYNYGIQVPENYFENTYTDYKNKITRLDCPGSCGFDFERLDTIDQESSKEEKFTIIYAGSFYGDGHSPKYFFEGLQKFIKEKEITEEDIKVKFYGDWENRYDQWLDKQGLGGIVHSFGWVNYETLLSELWTADVSLFIVRPFSGDEYNVPQKIIDYIASQTPMLVLSDRTWEVSKFTTDHNVGVVVEPQNPDDIKNGMNELYSHYKNSSLGNFAPSQDLLSQIDAETQTDRFASTLEETLN